MGMALKKQRGGENKQSKRMMTFVTSGMSLAGSRQNGVLWYHFLDFELLKKSEDWWHLGLHCPMAAVSWGWGTAAFRRRAHSLHPPCGLTPGLLHSCTLLSCPCSWVYILYYIHNTHKNHFKINYISKASFCYLYTQVCSHVINMKICKYANVK